MKTSCIRYYSAANRFLTQPKIGRSFFNGRKDFWYSGEWETVVENTGAVNIDTPNSSTPSNQQSLEQFNSYLLFLARTQVKQVAAKRVDPQDIVQQTLLQAKQKSDQFRGQNSAQQAAWLRRIMSNLLVDHLRRDGREVDEQMLAGQLDQSSVRMAEMLINSDSSPSQRVLKQERLCQLADALEQLPVDQRKAIELRHILGKTLQEMSETMDRSPAAISGLLQRGLKSLRSCLAPTQS